MPRVKIDYIVSFSSEDPENQASNLLATEVSKKKWLCSKGESSCSVVLQLSKAVQISTVQIGAYQSAMVEVLVGRSETPNEPFQVLVPRSVFLSPAEARRGAGDRVRSFSGEALTPAALQRWDRLRLVCDQPYNKHCQFGLSFVHVFSPEAAPAPAPATFSSDEEEFRPGELFAEHLHKHTEPTLDTGARIRQASSQALKNIPDSSIKLTKTPITKPSKRPTGRSDDRPGADRRRDGLLYTDHDARPHDKIDHHDDKIRDETTKRGDRPKENSHKKIDKQQDDSNKKDDRQRDGSHKKEDKHRRDKPKPQQSDRDQPSSSKKDEPSDGDKNVTNSGDDGPTSTRGRKRAHHDKKRDNECTEAGPVSSTPHTLLSDVVFVLSGYENPRRANVRGAALALGATAVRDWGPACTHLVFVLSGCAFPNTPKLRSVRAGAGGARAAVVRAEWVEACARLRRRLPWEWFATEDGRRRAPPLHWDTHVHDEESDTDDEIERVRQKIKKQRTDRAASPPRPTSRPASPPPADVSQSSDVEFVRDERTQSDVWSVSEEEGGSTDERSGGSPAREGPGGSPAREGPRGSLPDVFGGRTFCLTGEGTDTLARYVRAYGGLVIQQDETGVSGEPDYVVWGGRGGEGGRRGAVRAAWVWRCHRERRLVSPDRYRLT